MFDDFQWLAEMAGMVSSLTVVGGALMWGWEKFIGAPRERARIEREARDAHQLDEAITKSIKPLQEAIDRLTSWLEDSERDRKNLNRVLDETLMQLGGLREDVHRHEVEITVLKSKVNEGE